MATVGKLLLRGNRLIGLFLFDHVYDELPLRFRFSTGGIWRLKTVSHGFFSEHESSGLASSLLCRGRILGTLRCAERAQSVEHRIQGHGLRSLHTLLTSYSQRRKISIFCARASSLFARTSPGVLKTRPGSSRAFSTSIIKTSLIKGQPSAGPPSRTRPHALRGEWAASIRGRKVPAL